MYYSWKFNWLVWLVFNMYQYIILLNCIYMYKVRCTCDGLHTWNPTVKPLYAAPTSCKWQTPISDHQSKTKKVQNQIYSLQLEPLVNKHLCRATVASFLDDNFGVFYCFYPPVSNATTLFLSLHSLFVLHYSKYAKNLYCRQHEHW